MAALDEAFCSSSVLPRHPGGSPVEQTQKQNQKQRDDNAVGVLLATAPSANEPMPWPSLAVELYRDRDRDRDRDRAHGRIFGGSAGETWFGSFELSESIRDGETVEVRPGRWGTVRLDAAACRAPRKETFDSADFAHTTYENCHLTRDQFEAYKERFLGKPVPPQTISNDRLVALGYDLPEPWIQRCIEQDMPNFS